MRFLSFTVVLSSSFWLGACESKTNIVTPPAQVRVSEERPQLEEPEKIEEEVAAQEEAIPKPILGKALGNFQMTYYWVAEEPRNGNRQSKIVDKNCKTISKVSDSFRKRLALEGSGRLRDGRMVSTAGGCKCGSPCYWVAKKDKHPWGAGVNSRPLSPFRSVAVDPKEVRIGTSLYVAELDGLTMPGSQGVGGFVHDGCVVAEDRGGGVRGKQIDFFSARRQHYKSFFRRHKLTRVRVFKGGERCDGSRESKVAAANSGAS